MTTWKGRWVRADQLRKGMAVRATLDDPPSFVTLEKVTVEGVAVTVEFGGGIPLTIGAENAIFVIEGEL